MTPELELFYSRSFKTIYERLGLPKSELPQPMRRVLARDRQWMELTIMAIRHGFTPDAAEAVADEFLKRERYPWETLQ